MTETSRPVLPRVRRGIITQQRDVEDRDSTAHTWDAPVYKAMPRGRDKSSSARVR
jgi:hypothetical protein